MRVTGDLRSAVVTASGDSSVAARVAVVQYTEADRALAEVRAEESEGEAAFGLNSTVVSVLV